MAENLTDGQLTQEDLTIDSDSGSGDDDNWHSNKSSKGRVGSHVAQRWRYRELKTLKANLHSFLKEERIQLHEVLDGDKSKQFRTRTQFYRRLARGIKRPLFSVYRKVRREFRATNFVGPWRPEQVQHMLSEYDRHGKNWALIGCHLGMSARAVRDKHKNIANRVRIGDWLPYEEARLKAAIQRVHGEGITVKDLAYRGNWKRVAKYVKTRNSPQCRRKWLFHQEGKKAVSRKKQWTQQDELQLIDELLLQEEMEEEDDVDWVGMCSSNWDHARSHCYLKNKWLSLKRCVPGYSFKSFPDTLDYIAEYVRPIIAKRAEQEEIQSSDESEDEDEQIKSNN